MDEIYAVIQDMPGRSGWWYCNQFYWCDRYGEPVNQVQLSYPGFIPYLVFPTNTSNVYCINLCNNRIYRNGTRIKIKARHLRQLFKWIWSFEEHFDYQIYTTYVQSRFFDTMTVANL